MNLLFRAGWGVNVVSVKSVVTQLVTLLRNNKTLAESFLEKIKGSAFARSGHYLMPIRVT